MKGVVKIISSGRLKIYRSSTVRAHIPTRFSTKSVFLFVLAVMGFVFLHHVRSQELTERPSQQSPALRVEGVVAQYLMNPDGDLDGLLLANGTLVRFPPHLSHVLAQTVVPGDVVKIEGFSEAGPGTIHASAIVNLSSRRSAIDSPPPPRGSRPPREPNQSRQPITVSGTIRVLTHARNGDIDGAVLSDGSIIHCSPDLWARFSAPLKEGQSVAASGYGAKNEFGKSLEASFIGRSLNELPAVSSSPDPKAASPGPPPHHPNSQP